MSGKDLLSFLVSCGATQVPSCDRRKVPFLGLQGMSFFPSSLLSFNFSSFLLFSFVWVLRVGVWWSVQVHHLCESKDEGRDDFSWLMHGTRSIITKFFLFPFPFLVSGVVSASCIPHLICKRKVEKKDNLFSLALFIVKYSLMQDVCITLTLLLILLFSPFLCGAVSASCIPHLAQRSGG